MERDIGKNWLQEKMRSRNLETAVVILEKSVDLWLEAAPKYEVLKESNRITKRCIGYTKRRKRSKGGKTRNL